MEWRPISKGLMFLLDNYLIVIEEVLFCLQKQSICNRVIDYLVIDL